MFPIRTQVKWQPSNSLRCFITIQTPKTKKAQKKSKDKKKKFKILPHSSGRQSQSATIVQWWQRRYISYEVKWKILYHCRKSDTHLGLSPGLDPSPSPCLDPTQTRIQTLIWIWTDPDNDLNVHYKSNMDLYLDQPAGCILVSYREATFQCIRQILRMCPKQWFQPAGHVLDVVAVAYLGQATGRCPPPLAWTQKFFEHIEPKFFFNFWVGGTAPSPDPFFSGEGTPPPHTPPHWRLWRLEPRVFGSGPPFTKS